MPLSGIRRFLTGDSVNVVKTYFDLLVEEGSMKREKTEPQLALAEEIQARLCIGAQLVLIFIMRMWYLTAGMRSSSPALACLSQQEASTGAFPSAEKYHKNCLLFLCSVHPVFHGVFLAAGKVP